MIPFNKAIYLENSAKYVKEALESSMIAGDGKFTRLSSELMEKKFNAKKVLLTTSCTAALEMTALLLDIKEGDEVIMPSYTFVSTANAFVIHGGIPVFVDIRKDTMNIDENLIEEAITEKTKAIVVVHYAGVGCDMDKICAIGKKYNIPVIEDAAQGVNATYKGKYLGTIGDLGCYSFHETKNYTMGEGGALVINNENYIERAEILREKGTNRARFYRGQIDKYSWVDKGSSYLPSEMNVAYLYGQLECMDMINDNRTETWNTYNNAFMELQKEGNIELPAVPNECIHNAHMYYLKLKNLEERTKFISHMRDNGIYTVFHYVPLHSSEAGLKFGRMSGNDTYTTKESNRLVRLPMYYEVSQEDKERIINSLKAWCEKKK